jgi:tRNA 2-selenouridine synthase
LAGFEVSVLTGGYKAFRQSVLNDQISCEKLLVLGGYTGSGKTEILHEIQKLGHSILDLEKLACHKGSVFGAIGEPPQPSQEQFENELYLKLLRHDQNQILWVEDESKAIGKLRVPEFFYLQIRSTKVFFIEKSKEARLRFIEELYGQGNPEEFEHMIRKLSKRLGGLRLKMALEALKKEELKASAEIVLQYYDEGYLHGLEKRESGTYRKVDVAGMTDHETAKMLLVLAQEFYPTGEKT